MMTSSEYWIEVHAIGDTLNDSDALTEEYGEDADPSEVLWEITDGHEFVIYNFKALKVMEYTSNADAFFEQGMELGAPDSFFSMLPPLAMMAMQADVQDYMNRKEKDAACVSGG